MKSTLTALAVTLFLAGCSQTWEGVKEDSSEIWSATKQTTSEVVQDTKQAIHEATE